MTRFQRARKPEEKDERRRAILLAARDLAREVGARELSLNELGRRSGVSKPNIYRYFESREEVLFRLFVHELEEVVGEVEESLGSAPADVPEIADPIALEPALEQEKSPTRILLSETEQATTLTTALADSARPTDYAPVALNPQITHAIAIGILKRAWIDLIDGCALPPRYLFDLHVS